MCKSISSQAGIVAPVNTAFDPLPQYTFAYNVQDSLTGDSKSQQEIRDGEIVKGWSLFNQMRFEKFYWEKIILYYRF